MPRHLSSVNIVGGLTLNAAAGTNGQVLTSGGAGTNPTWTTAGSYTLPTATATALGGIELFSGTTQTTAANSVTTTASRTYGLQLNSDLQGVVNVPWSDTNTFPTTWTWTAGTTAGPTASITGTSSTITVAAVPVANNTTASGIVTTTTQTFGGAKTFSSAVTAAGLTLSSTTSPIILNASAGTSGQVLTSAGAGATPTWTTVSGGSFTGGTLTSGLVLATGTTTLQPLKFVAGTPGSNLLTTPVTGVKEYDGTVFYSTSNTNPGRALETQSYYYVSSSDFYIDYSGSGASQSMFGGPTTGLTVAAGTTYEFELDAAVQHQYQVNTGITGTFGMQNTGGATVAYTAFVDYGSNTTSFTTATTMSSVRTTGNVTFMAAISSGSRYGIIKVRGIIRVTGSGTTKVYPGLAASGTNDNTWMVASGAVFKMTPIGNGTVTTVGAWA